jgi:hypothetical protein
MNSVPVCSQYLSFLSTPQEEFDLIATSRRAARETVELNFQVSTIGVLNGIGVWFPVRLLGDIRLSSTMHNKAVKEMLQLFLPISSPFCVQAGERVIVTLMRFVKRGAVSSEWAILYTAGTERRILSSHYHSRLFLRN